MGKLRTDRGQLLLIGGVLLAISIIALAIVFNSAIYTSVLAGEGSNDISSQSAITFQQDVRGMGADLITEAIREHSGDMGDQEDYVEDNVGVINRSIQQYEADSNRIVDVTFNDSIEGTYVYNTTGSFANDAGVDDWTVGSDVTVRNFTMAITGTSGTDFAVEIHDGTSTYSVTVVGSNSIEIEDPSGDTQTCSGSGSGHLSIGITNATVDGDRCNALDFFERLERPYDIEFVNGENAEGRYGLNIDDGTPPSGATADREQLYGVTFDVEYYTTQMDYNATVRVAPGEPP